MLLIPKKETCRCNNQDVDAPKRSQEMERGGGEWRMEVEGRAPKKGGGEGGRAVLCEL